MAIPNRGWATWDDWFRYQGIEQDAASTIDFENYVYLLEAAADGRGIALGARGLIERYLESKRLVPLNDNYYKTDRALYAALTEHGENRMPARHCLKQLSRLI